MRKFVVAATLIALTLLPAAARAGFLMEASVGKGYQAAPTPRGWEQLNLEIAPGYAPSLPVLSWFRLQLGVVVDFADKSGSKTNMELRPMLALVPPIFPLYGRLIFGVDNLFKGKTEVVYGGALGLKIGLPGIAFVPALGIFAEAGLIPRKREFDTSTATTISSESKFAWVVEGRVGAYINF
jgi:hypothetical protein